VAVLDDGVAGIWNLAAEWGNLPGRGVVTLARDEQVAYFANHVPRMDCGRYRAVGRDAGTGMVESAGKRVIAAREKGPGTPWSDAGVQAVARVRVLLFNHLGSLMRMASPRYDRNGIATFE
jgi:hypothetical protein